MDIKIEIRKLYALHEATIRFDHSVKVIGQTTWTDFPPSRFIYAFFTFNSIYSFDWKTSFKEKKAIRWSANTTNRIPKEVEQFKAYLRYVDSVLTPNTSKIFREDLAPRVTSFGVGDPIEELKAMDLVNATEELKSLARQLPGEFGRLIGGRAKAGLFRHGLCRSQIRVRGTL